MVLPDPAEARYRGVPVNVNPISPFKLSVRMSPPTIVNFEPGVDIPIPTFPLLKILIVSAAPGKKRIPPVHPVVSPISMVLPGPAEARYCGIPPVVNPIIPLKLSVRMSPLDTCNFAAGVVVPIPTLPVTRSITSLGAIASPSFDEEIINLALSELSAPSDQPPTPSMSSETNGSPVPAPDTYKPIIASWLTLLLDR